MCPLLYPSPSMQSLLIGKNNYKFLIFHLELQYTSFLDLIKAKSRAAQLKEHMEHQCCRVHLPNHPLRGVITLSKMENQTNRDNNCRQKTRNILPDV